MGAWIETEESGGENVVTVVAPRVGAWIETLLAFRPKRILTVAPRVGAWIETRMAHGLSFFRASRTPCGCVD